MHTSHGELGAMGGLCLVRTATLDDLGQLTALKPPEALHRDRLREAGSDMSYLVAESQGAVVAFALLVFRRPATWPDAGDESRLPCIVDLLVDSQQRGRGIGTQFLHELETRARQAGHTELYLSVDPVDNPRACRLYRRLGYQPLQQRPHRERWSFVDSDGQEHHGEEWSIDMAKRLNELG